MSVDQMTSVEQLPADLVPARAPEVAIHVDGVGKMYRIYDRPQDRLKQMLLRGRRMYGREFWALRDISFDVHKGETVGIIGRNGSGKSTLLQIIAGTLAPSAGEVQINGRVAALLELGSGFNPEFTGRENVFLNGSILGFSREEMAQRFDEIAAFADIGDFIDQPVKTYSSGMFVRLAFAVQACVEPDILIVDEALAVGDVFFTQKCYRRMRALIDQGAAVVLVTHDVGTINQFCQRVMVLDQGHSLFYGNPVTSIRRYLALQRGEVAAIKHQAQATQTIFEDREYTQPATSASSSWPLSSAFLSLENASSVGTGQAELTAVALCNGSGEVCQVFEMGDAAYFYYEFRVLDDLSVPIGGVSLINDKDIIVHGKNSLQYKTAAPPRVSQGMILRFRQRITLDLAPGDYTFVIGLATIDPAAYESMDHFSYDALATQITRIASVAQVASFRITMRREGQALPYHGLCDLPGECALTLLPAQT